MNQLHVSVWLRPEPVAAQMFDELIRRLAAVHDTPSFSAHLSVVGDFDDHEDVALERLVRLADKLQPIDVELTDVRCEDVFYRSIYFAVAPKPVLMDAYQLAVKVWSRPGAHAFFPHVSLQYSRLPLLLKRELASTIDLDLPMRVQFDRISLWCTDMSDLRLWREIGSRKLVAG